MHLSIQSVLVPRPNLGMERARPETAKPQVTVAMMDYRDYMSAITSPAGIDWPLT